MAQHSKVSILLAPVVRKVDSAIHRMNHYPADSVRETNCAIQWIVIYLVDSVIHLVYNWGLMSNSVAAELTTKWLNFTLGCNLSKWST